MKYKRRTTFLTKQSRLLKFTKEGILKLGLTKEEVEQLIEMKFIVVAPFTMCGECFREIEEEDCPYCGKEEVAAINHSFYKYNDQYDGITPPFE